MGSKIRITENNKYYVEFDKNAETYVLTFEAFRLKNYKAFCDTGWIKANRMTIVYGANSSGKTALFYFMRFMYKCYKKRENGEIFSDTSRLRESDGSFSEMIYSGAPKDSKIEFWLRFSSKEFDKIEYIIRLEPTESGFDAQVAFAEIAYGNSIIDIIHDDGYNIENLFFITAKNNSEISEEYHIVNAVQRSVNELMNGFQMIGSRRILPTRNISLSGKDYEQIGENGINTYDILYHSSALNKRKDIVDEWLMNFGYSFYWKLEEGYGQFILKNNKRNTETNIVDNGYGISQSLPIAVAVASTERHSLLFIDSPEAFLQTRMQSEMMDLLLKVHEGSRLILETGSEYLLMRLRRRIAEKKVSSADLSVYFIRESEHEEAFIEEIRMDDTGEFIEAPDEFLSFFSADFEDLMVWEEITRSI